MALYNKTYSSEKEFKHRLKVYQHNLEHIENLNKEARANGKDTLFVVNKFADMSPKEFRQKFSKPITKPNIKPTHFINETRDPSTLPTNWDWATRTPTVVTSPYDQDLASCGSSYSFCAMELTETLWALKHNYLWSLSAQEILDCDVASSGCNGGSPLNSLDFIVNSGLEPLANYPYTHQNDVCTYDGSKVVAYLSGWGYSTQSGNDNSIQSSTYNDRTNIACLDASTWQFYGGGVLSHPCPGDGDQCVQITGWGVTTPSNVPYWIVRNSWGKNWGMGGYIWLERNDPSCGVVSEAYYGVAS